MDDRGIRLETRFLVIEHMIGRLYKMFYKTVAQRRK
jgi:hypothetical protein